MKNLKPAALLCVLLFGCKQAEKPVTSAEDKQAIEAHDDETLLRDLVRKLYAWHEIKSSGNDFSPLKADVQDSLYEQLDLGAHRKRIEELRTTGFFSEGFIQHYNRTALEIDQGLKDKTITWEVGYLPPFGNDSDPWCDCQDHPDNYWEKIVLKNVVWDKNKADFAWTWGDDLSYKARAVKAGGDWKIEYLQGFDFSGISGE